MSLIADFLMIVGACCAGFYCFILSRRLSRFTDLEKGVGGAVAVLSMQVDDLTKALDRAHRSSATATRTLEEKTQKAETALARLEIMMATLHDLPDEKPAQPKPRNVVRKRRLTPELAE